MDRWTVYDGNINTNQLAYIQIVDKGDNMANQVTDQDFETNVLNSNEPVIVDFWAEWCGPCKALGPLVDDLATQMQGKAKIVKMNIDDNPNIPTKYGIRGIPTLMVFKNGEVTDTKVGGMSKAQLEEWANQAV